MSSGFGLKGNVGRCYPFFADFKDCMQNIKAGDIGIECTDQKADYFECLHMQKTYARIKQINEQAKINAKGGGDDKGHH